MGWSLRRSVPTRASPVMNVVPLAPPKLSIATVPSWQERQSLVEESKATLVDVVPVVPLLYRLYCVAGSDIVGFPGLPFFQAPLWGVWQGRQISPLVFQAAVEKSCADPVICAEALVVARPRARVARSVALVFIEDLLTAALRGDLTVLAHGRSSVSSVKPTQSDLR